MNEEFTTSIMDLLEKSSQLKKSYWDCIVNNDYQGFLQHIHIYLDESYSSPHSKKIDAIKEVMNLVITGKEHQDTIAQFFLNSDLISPHSMLMCHWTHPANRRLFNDGYGDGHNYYISLWEKGFKIQEQQYDAFCDYFNLKDDFEPLKNDFLHRQNIFILNHELSKTLPPTSKTSKKPKI